MIELEQTKPIPALNYRDPNSPVNYTNKKTGGGIMVILGGAGASISAYNLATNPSISVGSAALLGAGALSIYLLYKGTKKINIAGEQLKQILSAESLDEVVDKSSISPESIRIQRPVEGLRLLSLVGEEVWDEESTFQAVLQHLTSRGYAVSNFGLFDRLEWTDKARQHPSEIMPYEIDWVKETQKYIRASDVRAGDLHEIVSNFDFGTQFAETGILRKEAKEIRDRSNFREFSAVYSYFYPTRNFYHVIEQLLQLRGKIKASSDAQKDDYMKLMFYAFPSLRAKERSRTLFGRRFGQSAPPVDAEGGAAAAAAMTSE